MDELRVIIVEKDSQDVDSMYNILTKNCPSVHIAGIFNTAKDACENMVKDAFDLIFLDVDVDESDVSGVLRKISSYLVGKDLVVLSRSTKHAFESYKFSAIDYILKPLVLNDVLKALQKVGKLQEAKTIKAEDGYLGIPVSIVAIPSLSDVKILKVSDIIYLQSEGRYTIFYTTQEDKIVSSKNLGYYEKLLAFNKNFFRIHHSYLVNIDLASNVYKKDGIYLEIYNKKYLPVSKRKTEAFYKFLGI